MVYVWYEFYTRKLFDYFFKSLFRDMLTDEVYLGRLLWNRTKCGMDTDKKIVPQERESACQKFNIWQEMSALDSFDLDKLKLLIEKVVVYGEDEIEIVWKVDDPFARIKGQ